MDQVYACAVCDIVECVDCSNGTEVMIEQGTLVSNASSISINGAEIVISNPKLFAEITSSASNFEIYPKLDGSIQFDMMFYHQKGEDSK